MTEGERVGIWQTAKAIIISKLDGDPPPTLLRARNLRKELGVLNRKLDAASPAQEVPLSGRVAPGIRLVRASQ